MSKKRAFILFAVALIVGGIGGYWGERYFWTRTTNKFICSVAAAKTGLDVSVLNQLRADNMTNAIDLLETRLDGSLIELGVYFGETPKSQREPVHLKILRMAKEYRSKFPHTSGHLEIDEGVARALALVDEEPKR